MPLIFVPKNPLDQNQMNVTASCRPHMQIIADQLMNDAIFHSCEIVITKEIEA